ncbi:Rv1733c family protein [Streptomyces sp. YIM S03343]
MTTARRGRVRKLPFWRWRGNTLRRRSDRVEAWVVLAAWIVGALATLGTGLAASLWVDHDLTARRAAAREVSAVLLEDAPEDAALTPYGADGTVWAQVRWTDPDGSNHTSRAKVDPGGEEGSRVTVWIGGQGTPVPRPPGTVEARLQAALLGVPAAIGAASLTLIATRLVLTGMERRRMAEWETEWAQIGPGWRKRMNG